ncbi:unnamed protein product [Pleuronectes platessa]|uniref:Uncharacterized protein n=1 Tax=Pleuronectes platessa TaxID=8262 RepID=A0A9N7Z2Q8_PLEPL|nr:unnamed protein product [Pleuronectes platessa]
MAFPCFSARLCLPRSPLSTPPHEQLVSTGSPAALPLNPPPRRVCSPALTHCSMKPACTLRNTVKTTQCWLYRGSFSCLLAQSSNPTCSQLTPPSSPIRQTTISTLPSFRLLEPSSAHSGSFLIWQGQARVWGHLLSKNKDKGSLAELSQCTVSQAVHGRNCHPFPYSMSLHKGRVEGGKRGSVPPLHLLCLSSGAASFRGPDLYSPRRLHPSSAA